MRQAIVGAAVCAVLAACGGEERNAAETSSASTSTNDAPQWAGTYVGRITTSVTCSNGGSDSQTIEGDTNVIASGFNEITQDANTPCPLKWNVTATTATLQPRTCTYTPSDGTTATATFSSGSATLSSPQVSGTMGGTFTWAAYPGVTCNFTQTFDGKR